MISAWRLVPDTHVSTAFSGEGARLGGGRWNRPGTTVVYLGGSPAIAALEVFVHIGSSGLHIPYFMIKVNIPKSLRISRITAPPSDWRIQPAPESTVEIGEKWYREGKTAILEVPSVIVPGEKSYILNPTHRDFRCIRICDPEPFSFDPRMLKLPPMSTQ